MPRRLASGGFFVPNRARERYLKGHETILKVLYFKHLHKSRHPSELPKEWRTTNQSTGHNANPVQVCKGIPPPPISYQHAPYHTHEFFFEIFSFSESGRSPGEKIAPEFHLNPGAIPRTRSRGHPDRRNRTTKVRLFPGLSSEGAGFC